VQGAVLTRARPEAGRRLFLVVAVLMIGGMLALWGVRQFISTGYIEIIQAQYGVPGRTCTADLQIRKHVSDACGGFRPRCLVSVSTGWCGDPAPGVVKTLTVDYACGTTRKRASAVEGTGLVLGCP
jgi:hypothetical protein